MVRIKRSAMTRKRHKNVLSKTKGFRLGHKNVFTLAKSALAHAGMNAYVGRREKKRDFRNLWTTRINNAVRPLGLSYSKFINLLYVKRVSLNRKVLSNLAISNPEVFAKIVAFVK